MTKLEQIAEQQRQLHIQGVMDDEKKREIPLFFLIILGSIVD